MSEEFDESEIIFSASFFPICRREELIEKENRPAVFSSSLPVNIPGRRYSEDEEYSEDGGRRMVPPHLIVGRRIESGQMAFSVCTGQGRTLKGRDLSRVRNSVLRLTGFLEA
ncbi:hypothetical protein DY000_02008926 [Brassica cretica]|uniref:Senescence regulator n=1 Tax=Brassica cretica TaxID=69181 RepID=A0ABQ7CJU8_BRACR|nr:hypothetical protein DY000_02008926 [Brassica cretica]